MTKLSNLWSACERMPTLAAVSAEWRLMLGEGYDAARVLLRPQAELAASYPCPSPHPCTCHHQIVDHGNGNIVAVCRCDPPYCDTVRLTRADIVVYELNLAIICSTLAKGLSFDLLHNHMPDQQRTIQIGIDSPCAGYHYPVYLTIPCGQENFVNTVLSLVARNVNPFILIAPTNRMCTPVCMEILQSKKSLFLTLLDLLDVSDSGKLIINPSCKKTITEFHNALVPALHNSEEAYPIAFFPTPAGARWNDVRIRFLDGHSVSIWVRDKSGVYSFSQMGMSKRNSAAPTAQWKLLEAFAEGRGVFDWENEQASRTQKKQKQLLSQALRDFFRIDGDPFRYVRDFKGWEARFDIEPCI